MFKRIILTVEAKSIPTPVVRMVEDQGAVATRNRTAVAIDTINTMQIFLLLGGVVLRSLMDLSVFKYKKVITGRIMLKAIQIAIFPVEFTVASQKVCYPLL
jgi:hypothetical protein